MTQEEKRTIAYKIHDCSVTPEEIIMLCEDWDKMQEAFNYAIKVSNNIKGDKEILKEECTIYFESGGRMEFITPGMMCVCEGCDGCIQRDQENEIHEAIEDVFGKQK